MKKIVHVLILLAGLMVAARENAFAGTLRGKIVDRDGRCLQNTRVDICVWNAGTNQWVSVAFAITGKDGFYYFTNLPAGQKVLLRIRGQLYPSSASPILIGNIPGNTYQDVAPITTP